MALIFYKSNTVFETMLAEYETMVAENISQKTKLISNDPQVVFSDAKGKNVIDVTVIYVTLLIFKMPI